MKATPMVLVETANGAKGQVWSVRFEKRRGKLVGVEWDMDVMKRTCICKMLALQLGEWG